MDNLKKLLEDLMQKIVAELECEEEKINVSFLTSEEDEAYSMGLECAIDIVKEKISEYITAYEAENSKYFAEKRWRKEDVASTIIGSDYEATEENIAKVIKTMQEKGYINVLLDCTDAEWRAITDAVEETLGGK